MKIYFSHKKIKVEYISISDTGQLAVASPFFKYISEKYEYNTVLATYQALSLFSPKYIGTYLLQIVIQ
jgi:hypothetical protein